MRGAGGLAWRTPSPTPDHWGRTADRLEAASVTSGPGFEELCFVVKPPQYPGQGLENFWSVGMWGCWLVEWGFCNKRRSREQRVSLSSVSPSCQVI